MSGEVERWRRAIDGGEVHALYVAPPDGAPAPAPAVIFAHGNAELAEEWIERLAPYRALGFAVLVPEYRGYGGAAGEPSEEAILDDFAAFYDRLAERPEVDHSRIVLHGRSLGGGVVGALSERRTVRALVLESTFTNVPDLASQWMAPAGAIRDRFDTREVLLSSATPTLILHGVRDELVPFRHAVELHRVAWDSELVAFEAGHDDLPRGPAYWARIRRRLVRAGALPPQASTVGGG